METESESGSDSESDASADVADNGSSVHDIVADESPCLCGNCAVMPTAQESRCCMSFPKVVQYMQDCKCITQHPGFAANCTNSHVLQASMHEFVQMDGPIGDEISQNE